ncbi:4-hydroxy-tetrahydrodipicolinate synthase [Planococcus lenghuensis]|uniref:4-hydroxy-tetrahydrodipicolinate synthase n=1 Tax=Planococcus lenghuensis TaxID=2213202 RepID=A0A1Q2KYB1_9BACL|nr:4-hydroxy-tetrahydrodipicolinate synthase [Planococcus lenghuensis]AQQ53094.1 4-hydroxy-tetrahydrodipicolinate synthase [Planococcus lenghuensis]
MTHLFTGIGVAVTAPFRHNEIDAESFRRHLEFLMDNGVQSLIINGTTGEGSTLTAAEKRQLLEIAVQTAGGRVPVIAGTGSNSTEASIAASLEAQEIGVDGLMLITPYYNKTSQRGLVAHFTAVADAVELPILLYNVPSRTGMTITPETVQALSMHSNIAGLKDATSDFNYLSQVKLLTDDAFALYSGNDDSVLPFLALGGHGLISVAANVLPADYAALYEQAQTDLAAARSIHYRLYPLISALGADVNPIPVKALTAHLGFGEYEVRLPLVPLEEDVRQNLVELFDGLRAEVQ